MVQYQKSMMHNTIPKTKRFYQRAIEDDNQNVMREEMERYLKKNRNGNYGIFADNCDHCIERPPHIEDSSESSL